MSRFDTFRAKLEAEGYDLRPLRSGTVGERPARLYAVGRDQHERPLPKTGTIIVLDYGEDGFGLYTEAPGLSLDESITAIITG